MTYSQWCVVVVVIGVSAVGLTVSLEWGTWPGVWLGLLINATLHTVTQTRS